jgi:YVTN family beta-propeller protein
LARLVSAVVLAACAAPSLLFYIGVNARAADSPKRSLLALSKHDHSLVIVDPSTLQPLGRVPVGPDPHEVIASSDGRTAYVSIYGGGRYHVISVVDVNSQRALPEIDTGALNGPHGLTFVGGKLWFTAEGAKAIARYDPNTQKVDWILGTGQNRTHMIYVAPNQKQIFTTNISSGTVSLIDLVALPPMGPPPGAKPPSGSSRPPAGGPPLRTDWNETVVPVGRGDEGFDVAPSGRELWTANAQDGTLSVVDVEGKRVTATLDAKVQGANRLKFTPDGKRVFISSLGHGDLVIYDAASRKQLKRVPIGHGAAGILMDPVSNRVFVACSPDNYIAVVDLQTLKVTGHLNVGGEPDGLAWAVQQ